jgi:hypothetical protein
MTARKMGAALTAIFLGTAAIGAASLTLTLPAQAQTVSAAVGRPLQEALQLAQAKKWREAMDKVNVASAAAKTSAEQKAVATMKHYVGANSGDVSLGGADAAKVKFAQDFAAGNLKAVIADGDIMKKAGALDSNGMLVVAQSYLRLHDTQNCINYIKHTIGAGAGEEALQTLQRCAFEAHDDATQRDALEQLVARTGKATYWSDLLKLSQNAKGLNDHNTLDIYRLKLLTGSISAGDAAKAGDDYTTLSKLALQLHFAAESQAVLEKAIAVKAINADDRNNRLLSMAKGQAGADAAGQAKALAAAKGDDKVQIGEDQIGQGKPKDAIATIKSGIDTGPKDMGNAQLRLGTAYLAAGQKADAIKTFNGVKGDDNVMMVAHLYALYAKH